MIFNYAIDASWAKPTPNPPTDVPYDFPISANEPEAFDVQINFPTNTLQYMDGGQVTGQLTAQAVVSDWQGIKSGNMQNEVDEVDVFAPSLLTAGVKLDFAYQNAIEAVYQADLTPFIKTLNSADPHLLLAQVKAKNAGTYTQGGQPRVRTKKFPRTRHRPWKFRR